MGEGWNGVLSTVTTRYNGGQSYRTSLIARGNQKADKFFVMRNQLTAYCSGGLVPQFYSKSSQEKDHHRLDEVTYNYNGGKLLLKQNHRGKDGKNHQKSGTYGDNVYDMLNMFMRARSFSTAGWKKGWTYQFRIADGNSVNPARLVFNGKSNIKADNGRKYRCLELRYYEDEGKGYKNIATFFVTDDANHVPIRLDMTLKFGSAKAFLVSMKGERNAVAAQVK